MKTLLNDWLFYMRMFFDRFFINVLMVSVSVALGVAFVIVAMRLDVAVVIAASQDRMTLMGIIVFSVAVAFSVIDMIVTVIEDALSKKEAEKEKLEAAPCSEKPISPLV